jgi:hypothetical protein
VNALSRSGVIKAFLTLLATFGLVVWLGGYSRDVSQRDALVNACRLRGNPTRAALNKNSRADLQIRVEAAAARLAQARREERAGHTAAAAHDRATARRYIDGERAVPILEPVNCEKEYPAPSLVPFASNDLKVIAFATPKGA